MWSTKQKAAVGGVVAAVVIGGGGGFVVAHASDATRTPTATATSSPTGSATTGTTGKATKATKAKAGAKDAVIGNLKDFQHAEWVSKSANGYVTHDAILGQVTAVSPASVTVQAADGTSLTYSVASTTKVHQAGAAGGGKAKATATSTASPTATATTPTTAPATPTAATMADVTVGQTVLVSGAKSPDLVASTVMVRAS
ncbi:hypothetical protein [Lapillicoccus sp.]|uniref:hypothetical protein n=1 Tax=Lapillicoccus sp. TaxID=1909287 RepID=UPI0032679262